MIHIGGDWYVGGDSMNTTLYCKKKYKTGKNKGEEYFEESGYYGNLKQVLDAIERKEFRLGTRDLETLQELDAKVDATHEMIRKFFVKYEKEVKELRKIENAKNGKRVPEI